MIARQRGGIARGCSILDVGCGFGLETLRLASLVAPGGKVACIDNSVDFIAEAQKARRRGEIADRFSRRGCRGASLRESEL